MHNNWLSTKSVKWRKLNRKSLKGRRRAVRYRTNSKMFWNYVFHSVLIPLHLFWLFAHNVILLILYLETDTLSGLSLLVICSKHCCSSSVCFFQIPNKNFCHKESFCPWQLLIINLNLAFSICFAMICCSDKRTLVTGMLRVKSCRYSLKYRWSILIQVSFKKFKLFKQLSDWTVEIHSLTKWKVFNPHLNNISETCLQQLIKLSTSDVTRNDGKF